VAWLTLIIPALLWVKAVWLSPFLKTHRHGLSGALSLIAGGLMFSSLKLDDANRPVLFCASAVAVLGMIATLLLPPRHAR
jgi:hypothetical protein